MSTFIINSGIRYWDLGVDDEGHRTYKLKVQTGGGYGDGPWTHRLTPGLPLEGSLWLYEAVADPWAWCTGASNTVPRQPEGNAETVYDHTFTYTTRPRGTRRGMGGKDDRARAKKCSDQTISDPLSEPPRTSGGTVRYTEEAQEDGNGYLLVNTAFEPFKGPVIEFDASRGQVTVEQNVPSLQLDVVEPMRDHVNDATLWDLPARCWKLTDFHWERKLYGSCSFYYTRKFTFESRVIQLVSQTVNFVDFDGTVGQLVPGTTYSGWDKYIDDDSSRAVKGQWVQDGTGPGYIWQQLQVGGQNPDYTKQGHYIPVPAIPGGAGNMRVKLSRTNRGAPALNLADVNIFRVRKYWPVNFLTLGIPTTL